MPFIALPRWNLEDTYYSQTNNVVESILSKVKANRLLESCGPTSAVMLLDAIDKENVTPWPESSLWRPQPEDLLSMWFNDPRNYDAMLTFRSDIHPKDYMGNEVPQWYEAAIPAVFGIRARFYWGATTQEIHQAISNGRGVLICLTNPGHYIAIVASDSDKQQFIYHDPWPSNSWPASMAGKPGFKRSVSYNELMSNVQPFRVEIG